jgi:hypothetical protein
MVEKNEQMICAAVSDLLCFDARLSGEPLPKLLEALIGPRCTAVAEIEAHGFCILRDVGDLMSGLPRTAYHRIKKHFDSPSVLRHTL